MTEDEKLPLNEPASGEAEDDTQAAPEPEQDDASTAEDAVDSTSEGDSATFSRCALCRHAEEVDPSGGTLLCGKHDMRVNAEADEIPDDCPDFDPAESS